MYLFAVHISDGVLATPFWAAGFVVAGVLLLLALSGIEEDEIPRIGLLTAAFFVASSIHVKIPPTSAHLVLNALVGVVLGGRAPLAVAVGLLLQAALLAHGGFTTLGVNTVVISLPALLAGPLFRFLAGRRGLPGRRRAFWAGAVTGFGAVVLTATLNAVVLITGGVEDWTIIAAPQFAVYLVLGVIEGVILGVTAEYLRRVKPELLNLRRTANGAAGANSTPAAPADGEQLTSSRSRTGS
ncbi:MAG TPA: CbiM family transporter [Gemmataceae bacterium]|nr:CbiM family transporter [Gemmataceae bacterium]